MHESLGAKNFAMLKRPSIERLTGSDFGVPASAGQQARKIILIEAVRKGQGDYEVLATGRNERLVRDLATATGWMDRRRGYTLPSLASSLAADSTVSVSAFDFPFSIPIAVLEDEAFAQCVGHERFRGRAPWAQFVGRELNLSFATENANATLADLGKFKAWRVEPYSLARRRTDQVTGGSPPLKHRYQNLFAMTLGGVAMLEQLRTNGVTLALSPAIGFTGKRLAIETYPAVVARNCGFEGSYKSYPAACMSQAESYLAGRGIRLSVDRLVRQFCHEYATRGMNGQERDPDGADTFLCLVAAICFRESIVEWCSGDANRRILLEEGCIVAPLSKAS